MDSVLVDIINGRIVDLKADLSRLEYNAGYEVLMNEMQICINIYQGLLIEYNTKINQSETA